MATQPKKLGKYDIIGKIGKGAMGEVYKGHDPVLNRHVAIKIIAETIDADSDVVERFKREARNAAQLNHPNIVTIYDFVEDEGHLYMVMELLEGQDLKELIKSGAPLTMEQILSIMEQITDGLGFAHTKDIIHRDLKPANVFISKNGQVKILDFGLVHEASSDMTKTGQVMGTPNYMSPEQVQGLKVDPRSDIFALGAVFYELLTRKKPFGADSIHATMFKVVQGDREPLAKYTHLPRPLVSMVDRALNKEPEDRFRDANDLRQHLRVLRSEVLRGGSADSTLTGRAEATILTPAAEPTHVPPSTSTSASSAQGPVGSERSVPSRSVPSVGSVSRGTIRRGDQSGSGSGAMGTSYGARASGPPVALYALAAVLVVAVAGGAYYVTNRSSSDRGVEQLTEALNESKRQLMLRSFEQKDYEGALAQAEELLAALPGDADATRVQAEAREALDTVEQAVSDARQALESGDTDRAAESLATVLELDPTHPLGTELSGQLDQHFQSRAENARGSMDASRSAAVSAGAQSRPEFDQGERVREQATVEFNGGHFTEAARSFLAARDLFDQSRTAQAQAQAQREAQANRSAAAAAEVERQLEAGLREAETAWTRAKSQPSPQGLEQLPLYQRALAEEQLANRLKSSGDLAGATQSFEGARSFLERARREYDETEARAQSSRATRAAATTTAPVAAPTTTSLPTVAQDENEIRQVLATYERALETENVSLFRDVKPNLTADELERLQNSFDAVDSMDVELAIGSITIDGARAMVTITRRDTFVVRGRSQNGNERQQSFAMTKAGGRWVIDEIR